MSCYVCWNISHAECIQICTSLDVLSSRCHAGLPLSSTSGFQEPDRLCTRACGRGVRSGSGSCRLSSISRTRCNTELVGSGGSLELLTAARIALLAADRPNFSRNRFLALSNSADICKCETPPARAAEFFRKRSMMAVSNQNTSCLSCHASAIRCDVQRF